MAAKHTVLIVDDEIEIGEILGALLEDHFDCSIFDKASDGLAALKDGLFEYIITDIEMPDINGIRFIEEARKLSPNSLIFVSTGHDHFHPRVQAALAAGAHGVLTKPYANPDDLVAHLIAFSDSN
jgi:DNA-binding NtrC family response regulator